MGERESPSGFFGLLTVGIGICCGLPLLVSAGVLGAAAGLGFGSWLAILLGAAVTVVGLWRWRYEAGIDDRAV